MLCTIISTFAKPDPIRLLLESEGIQTEREASVADFIASVAWGSPGVVVVEAEAIGERDLDLLATRLPSTEQPFVVYDAKRDGDVCAALEAGCARHVLRVQDALEIPAAARAVLRRKHGHCTNTIRFGNLSLELGAGRIYCRENLLPISGKPALVLAHLILSGRESVSSDSLLRNCGSSRAGARRNRLCVFVYRLRALLAEAGANVDILPHRGFGYRLFEDRSPKVLAGAALVNPRSLVARTTPLPWLGGVAQANWEPRATKP